MESNGNRPGRFGGDRRLHKTPIRWLWTCQLPVYAHECELASKPPFPRPSQKAEKVSRLAKTGAINNTPATVGSSAPVVINNAPVREGRHGIRFGPGSESR